MNKKSQKYNCLCVCPMLTFFAKSFIDRHIERYIHMYIKQTKKSVKIISEPRYRSRQLISLMSQGLSARCPVHLSHFTRHVVATHQVEIK